MKLTNAADEMIQRLGKIHTAEYMVAVIGLAEEIATEQGLSRIATMHIKAAMAEMEFEAALADPMSPDYPALAAEEPVSQVEDCRDAAEVMG